MFAASQTRNFLSRKGLIGLFLLRNGARLPIFYGNAFDCHRCAISPFFVDSFHCQIRYFSSDQHRSKVEKTLDLLREDLQRQEREAAKKREVSFVSVKEGNDVQLSSSISGRIRSIGAVIKKEFLHYYHGFRLLWLEVGISAKYVWQIFRGRRLNRRERKQLVRTVSDLFRLIPFSVFIIVPFMEFLLPFFIKFFPSMLPSTFQEASKEEDKLRRQLKIRLEMAKFLQDTIEDISLERKANSDDSSDSKAAEFGQFIKKIRTEGGYVSNAQLFKFSKLFEDELTLDNLPMSQLRALCRMLDIQPFGTPNVLRFQLTLKLRALKADDRQISAEGGVDALNVAEVQHACRARGMRALGMSEKRLRKQLRQWLELSLDDLVPPSLLLMSRTLYLPEDLSFTDRLKLLVSSLPDGLSEQTRQRLTELEGGAIDNKDRLDLIRNIEEAIRKDKEADKRREDEAKKIAEESTSITTVEPDPEWARKEVTITRDDLLEIEDILHETGGVLYEEKHDIAELKEQIQEHSQDLKKVDSLPGLQESEITKKLRLRVNSMISNVDLLIDNLEKEKIDIDQGEDRKAHLIRIDDLLSSLGKLKTVTDESQRKHVADVLKAMDEDTDGKIDIDLAFQVIELLAEESDLKLTKVQMTDIIDMLRKEDAMETMDKIANSEQRKSAKTQ